MARSRVVRLADLLIPNGVQDGTELLAQYFEHCANLRILAPLALDGTWEPQVKNSLGEWALTGTAAQAAGVHFALTPRGCVGMRVRTSVNQTGARTFELWGVMDG